MLRKVTLNEDVATSEALSYRSILPSGISTVQSGRELLRVTPCVLALLEVMELSPTFYLLAVLCDSVLTKM